MLATEHSQNTFVTKVVGGCIFSQLLPMSATFCQKVNSIKANYDKLYEKLFLAMFRETLGKFLKGFVKWKFFLQNDLDFIERACFVKFKHAIASYKSDICILGTVHMILWQ